jgi:16S rRNA (uracil1498-N3)-methyltransferase
MRLTRIHVAGLPASGALLQLEPQAAAHLTRVLRLKAGARIAVFDGAGREHDATLEALRGDRVEIRIGAARPTPPPSRLSITLAQGISRGDRMEYAIQKATELGVTRIVPLFCERSVVKLDERQAARKLEHWLGVAISAAEQCGRADLPQLMAPRRLADHLAAARGAEPALLRLVLAPNAAITARQLPGVPTAIEILIGPEGGLGDDELALAAFAGYTGLRLGPRVLRTETAAAAAIAALQTLHGDLG